MKAEGIAPRGRRRNVGARTPRIDHIGGHKWALSLASALFVLPHAAACGSDSDAPAPSGTGGGVATGGVSAAGAGGATASGGAGTGGVMAGAGGVASGGTTASGGATGSGAACGVGQRTQTGACYVPCDFAPAMAPSYDATGACASIGWRCSEFQYCNLTFKCATDATCTGYAGPGWRCIDASGPLIGQCALGCNTDADCPPPNPRTNTPYTCGPAQTTAGVIQVCRFAGTGA